MAHPCPDCGQACYCGGDIDDICFEYTRYQANCTCCDARRESEEEYEDIDDEEGE